MTHVNCPQCGRTLKSANDLSGKSIRCPKCKHAFSVAAQQELVAPYDPPTEDVDFASDEQLTERPATKAIGAGTAKIGPGLSIMRRLVATMLLVFIAWKLGSAFLKIDVQSPKVAQSISGREIARAPHVNKEGVEFVLTPISPEEEARRNIQPWNVGDTAYLAFMQNTVEWKLQGPLNDPDQKRNVPVYSGTQMQIRSIIESSTGKHEERQYEVEFVGGRYHGNYITVPGTYLVASPQ